jgi:hypothetical protein
MKRFMLALVLLALSAGTFADQTVRGYTRRDGTYVAPHQRSDPNQYRYDNYSSQGNVNPYTGRQGTQPNEFSNPPVYNRSNPNSGFATPRSDDSPWDQPRRPSRY